MKTEDFERLKKLCDENGFELVTESPKDNDKFFVVKKKDIWEGVEFFMDAEGTVRKIKDETERKVLHLFEKCKQSTEQAYVEQLKKESFERFGEIESGNFFNLSKMHTDWVKRMPIHFSVYEKDSFDYDKKTDTLYFSGVPIYSEGKWAERVNERISIRWEECDGNYIKFSYSGSVNLIPRMNELSALLEKYLNNEIE